MSDQANLPGLRGSGVAESSGLRTVSYGGGVQSTALLVLAAQSRIDFGTFLFANVGDDSEHPASLAYVRDVAAPFVAEHGIALHELQRTRKDGTVETLWQRITKPQHRAITIPFRGAEGQPQSRHCTRDFKVQVIAKWLKANGATEDNPATVAIGISVDEIERAGKGTDEKFEHRVYPLLDLGLNRGDCMEVIRSVGLPVPPKSSCFFCPFSSVDSWRERARNEPNLFMASVALEAMQNARQKQLGHPPLYLTRFGKPLDEAINADQQAFQFDGPEGCDEGYCWT